MWHSNAVETDRHSRAWRYSLCVSIVLHIAIVVGIAGWSVARSLRLTFQNQFLESVLDVTYTRMQPAAPGEQAPDIVDSLIGSIPSRLDQALKLDVSERTKRLRKGMLDLSQVRESSMIEIADLFDTDDRAYQPVVPPPSGPFDFDSQIPYSMKKLNDGGFAVVLLDKDGRTTDITHSKEEVTEDMKAAYEIFKMMETVPAFRKLYMRFAAQYLPKLKGVIDE
ncbi:hypothetical protein ACFL01_01715 [Planctomycetota bacterium]